jgi:C1A family cysteine protease
MKNQLSLIILFSFAVFSLACHKEKSNENKQNYQDTSFSNYPFANGYCDGTSLGISIIDTGFFTPDLIDNLPSSVLLDMPAAGDQGDQNSCSAWAAVFSAGNYYNHIKNGIAYSDTSYLSPTYTYNQITKGTCTCTSILDNLYLLKTQGACTLREMTYDPANCSVQPDSLQKSEANNFKIGAWLKIDLQNLQFIKEAVYEKKPVLFAINTDDGFNRLDSPYIWKTRIGSLGQPHAMTITGYDESKKSFRIMNSWSKAWADNGFAWIDYNFFLDNVLSDGYIIAE